jgi:hypothetical protein
VLVFINCGIPCLQVSNTAIHVNSLNVCMSCTGVDVQWCVLGMHLSSVITKHVPFQSQVSDVHTSTSHDPKQLI